MMMQENHQRMLNNIYVLFKLFCSNKQSVISYYFHPFLYQNILLYFENAKSFKIRERTTYKHLNIYTIKIQT